MALLFHHRLNLLLFLLVLLPFLSACASPSTTVNPDMTCDEIQAEIQTLRQKTATRDTSSEVNRTIDTGTTVVAQGASIAGVPYVGSVFSIGKTLLSHGRKTSEINAQKAEERLFNLQDLAYEKGCFY